LDFTPRVAIGYNHSIGYCGCIYNRYWNQT